MEQVLLCVHSFSPLSHGTLNLDCPIHMWYSGFNWDSITIESGLLVPVQRWIISGFRNEIVESRSQAPESARKDGGKGTRMSNAEPKLLLEIWS